MHNKVFYGWKVSNEPKFDEFSPGILIMGKIIEDLINKGFTNFNFMAGDYPYKRSWAPQGAESTNYELIAASHSLYPWLFLKYRLEWRDRLRDIYHQILEKRWGRVINRWIQAQRQK